MTALQPTSRRRAVYVAHQLSAPTREGIDANRKEAARWAAFLAKHFDVAPECSWIVLTGEWDETEENRRTGIDVDLALVACCRELVMVGPRVSSGMLTESQEALRLGLPVFDLTGLPRDPEVVALSWMVAKS